MEFFWKKEKNDKLKAAGRPEFIDALHAIADGQILRVLENPNPTYLGQQMYLLNIRGYPHLVPFRDKPNGVRELITIIPNRKFKKELKQ